MTPLSQNPEVIVVGAGAAGLAAAKALRDHGIDTLLLEAADHIGGRCVTDTTTFATPFDRGGSWLHTAAINPLARIAEARGDALYKSPWRWARAQSEGTDLTPLQVQQCEADHDAMWPAIIARGGQTPDVSMLEAMPPSRWGHLTKFGIAQQHAGDADLVSAEDCHNYTEAEGDWLVGGGLGAFVASLHADVPVQLKCPVSRIDTSGKRVVVSTPLGALHADHVILTVSTGVLGADTITFVPPLPAAKRDAIATLPCGLLNKVALEFDTAWQDAAPNTLADYHAGDEAFCSISFGFYGGPLAVGFVAGRFADALELDGPGAATAFCLEGLQAMFGADALKHVRHTDETRWRSDPLAMGSYSYATPGNAGARSILGEPIAEKLFFAGEAVMQHTYSTVHGAVQSGQQAARQVLDQRNAN